LPKVAQKGDTGQLPDVRQMVRAEEYLYRYFLTKKEIYIVSPFPPVATSGGKVEKFFRTKRGNTEKKSRRFGGIDKKNFFLYPKN